MRESDKTVSVMIFRKLNGDPIAVYYNYAMHAVAAGQLDMVSGDAPGAASNYIEDSFDTRWLPLVNGAVVIKIPFISSRFRSARYQNSRLCCTR
jgi:hypothetical protein